MDEAKLTTLPVYYVRRMLERLVVERWAERRKAGRRIEYRSVKASKGEEPADYRVDSKGVHIDPTRLPGKLQEEWQKLLGNESTKAIAQRIRLIMDANGINYQDFYGEKTENLASQLSAWKSGQGEKFEGQLEKSLSAWSKRLVGVPPFLLRTGFDPQAHASTVLGEIKGIPVGQRLKRLRQWRGLMREEVERDVGLPRDALRSIENRGTKDFDDPSLWGKLAARLDVDVFILVAGHARPQALAKRTLGQRICLLREVCGWTRQQLAHKAYVSKEMLDQIEQDQEIPKDPAVFQRLAKSLGASPEELSVTFSLSNNAAQKSRNKATGKFQRSFANSPQELLKTIYDEPDLYPSALSGSLSLPQLIKAHLHVHPETSASSIRRLFAIFLVEKYFVSTGRKMHGTPMYRLTDIGRDVMQNPEKAILLEQRDMTWLSLLQGWEEKGYVKTLIDTLEATPPEDTDGRQCILAMLLSMHNEMLDHQNDVPPSLFSSYKRLIQIVGRYDLTHYPSSRDIRAALIDFDKELTRILEAANKAVEEIRGQKGISKKPAGMVWGTSEATRVDEASKAFQQFARDRAELLAEQEQLSATEKAPISRPPFYQLQEVGVQMRKLQRVIDDALSRDTPLGEQPHFKPVREMLMSSLFASTFPRTEDELFAHPTVQEREAKWIVGHAQRGRGRVFDLEQMVFVAYQEALHRLPLLTLHRKIVRAMWEKLKFYNDLVERPPAADWKGFFQANQLALVHVADKVGIEVHRDWNTNKTHRNENKIAGLKDVEGPPPAAAPAGDVPENDQKSRMDALHRLKGLVPKPPRVLCLVGPTGAGKSALRRMLLQGHPETFVPFAEIQTRPKYLNEASEDEQFITEQQFKERLAAGHLLATWKRYGYSCAIDEDLLIKAVLSGRTLLVEGSRESEEIKRIWPDAQVRQIAILPTPLEGSIHSDDRERWIDILTSRIKKRDPSISDAELSLRLKYSLDQIDTFRRTTDGTVINSDESPLATAYAQLETIALNTFKDRNAPRENARNEGPTAASQLKESQGRGTVAPNELSQMKEALAARIAHELGKDPKDIEIREGNTGSEYAVPHPQVQILVRSAGREWKTARLIYQLDRESPPGTGVSFFPRQMELMPMDPKRELAIRTSLQAYLMFRHQADTYYALSDFMPDMKTMEQAGLLEPMKDDPRGDWVKEAGFLGAWAKVRLDRVREFFAPPTAAAPVTVSLVPPEDYHKMSAELKALADEHRVDSETLADVSKDFDQIPRTFEYLLHMSDLLGSNASDKRGLLILAVFAARDAMTGRILGAKILRLSKVLCNLPVVGEDAVRVADQRRGIGTQLRKASFDWMIENGHYLFAAMIEDFNTPSRDNLYKLVKQMGASIASDLVEGRPGWTQHFVDLRAPAALRRAA